jgi:phage terminase small subunit
MPRKQARPHPTPPPDPPEHLSDRAKALWRSVVPRRAKSPERLAMVQTALEALDRADGARLAIAEQGLTTVTKTTGTIHLNPLAGLEREARAQFLSAWTALHFSWDSVLDGGNHPLLG